MCLCRRRAVVDPTVVMVVAVSLSNNFSRTCVCCRGRCRRRSRRGHRTTVVVLPVVVVVAVGRRRLRRQLCIYITLWLIVACRRRRRRSSSSSHALHSEKLWWTQPYLHHLVVVFLVRWVLITELQIAVFVVVVVGRRLRRRQRQTYIDEKSWYPRVIVLGPRPLGRVSAPPCRCRRRRSCRHLLRQVGSHAIELQTIVDVAVEVHVVIVNWL